ncbi:LlaJI family restriction endonuclease [Succiniclasticum ruminis]|uniref:LlaJI restriction endonuclease n=1 Tax=Succiniclasticum ruminis DSM 9236 TaxID=1123323 RepID=A0A1I2BZ84_9FIRM|nr:LlaJI family restriction endonuclease [Succiniclasticum ruminis]SFE61285.1 LlaJI restriction endonuclease [Succiniclasticum ruminis DSM 9236]
MISKFLREQKRYSQRELCAIFECSEEKVVPIIRKLKEFGVFKAVRATDTQRSMSELLEEDIEVADVETGEDEYLYVLTFVGVITVAGRVLKCYPKYLLHNSEPKKELHQIIKVLQKFNKKEQIVRVFNNSSVDHAFNLLAVLLFFLTDYYENGSYTNTEDIVQHNGSGEILWDKTINETFMFLSDNRPYYIDLQTKKRIEDNYDYFKRLHECILTTASKELRQADLLEIFEITEVNLSDELLDDFGDRDYILSRIEKELNIQFNTRKQILLKTIYAYIAHSGSLYDTDCLSMFGTNSFSLVWERVCADILDNKLDAPLSSLRLPVPLRPEYYPSSKLIDLIERPLWTITGKTSVDTLIPDLITIVEKDDKKIFVIFDAKYYNALLEPGVQPRAHPGIESVTKQYLYQLAYQKFIKDHQFAYVRNCFLMPTDGDRVINKGAVSLQMLDNLDLQRIQVRLIPAQMAFRLYLAEMKLNPEGLDL